MKVTTIGIDLAKSVFQVCGVNQAGKPVFNRQLRRNKLLSFLAQYPNTRIAMEACGGSNYWGRTLLNMGYDVVLLPPQHVKPFVKGNKNDRNDAFAICEASNRPSLRVVQPNTLEQTDMMLLHRIRERHVSACNGLTNQIRGLLNEYGIVLPQGKARLRHELAVLIEDASNELTEIARQEFQLLIEEWYWLDEKIKQTSQKITRRAREHKDAQRLMTIRGVAEITATAVIGYAGDGSGFKNGRQFAASLGLVPKEHSSGGKQRLGGITKRGNRYLRCLLVQCAWCLIRHSGQATDALSVWVKRLIERRGKHKAALALANKLARTIWAMLYYKTTYRDVVQAV